MVMIIATVVFAFPVAPRRAASRPPTLVGVLGDLQRTAAYSRRMLQVWLDLLFPYIGGSCLWVPLEYELLLEVYVRAPDFGKPPFGQNCNLG